MKVFSVAFFCISALLLTGCFSTSEPRKIETKLEQGVQVSEAELAKTGEAYLRQVVAALEKNDHAKFTEHNIPEYNRMVTKEVFRKIAEDFRKTHGKMGEPQYLGCINKYSGKILLWKVIFERTPFVNEQLKKSGHDPAKIPQTDSLVRMMLGKTDKGWKIIRVEIQ